MKLKWTTSVKQTIIMWCLISQRVHYLFITRKISLGNEIPQTEPEMRHNSRGKAMGGQKVPMSHLTTLYLVIRNSDFSRFKKLFHLLSAAGEDKERK